MTIFWYLSRQYLKVFLMITFVIGAIVFIVDGIDQYSLVKSYGGDVGQAFIYVGLRVPNSIYNFLPLIFLIAALSFFMNLSRHSELVALRAAGISAARIVFVPIIMTLFLSLMILGPFHYLMVNARGLSKDLINTVLDRPSETIRTVQNGIWIRESFENENRFIHIEKVNWKNKRIQNAEFFTTNSENTRQHIIASSAWINNGNWIIKTPLIINSENKKTQLERNLQLPTNLNFDDLFSVYNDPLLVQLKDMPTFLNRLVEDGYDERPAKTLFYSELATPLFYAFLCLLGSIFALAPMRGGGTSRRVIMALGTGFGFYFLTKLTESAAKAGNLPVLLGVLAVPLAGLLFSFALLLHQEDG